MEILLSARSQTHEQAPISQVIPALLQALGTHQVRGRRVAVMVTEVAVEQVLVEAEDQWEAAADSLAAV